MTLSIPNLVGNGEQFFLKSIVFRSLFHSYVELIQMALH